MKNKNYNKLQLFGNILNNLFKQTISSKRNNELINEFKSILF